MQKTEIRIVENAWKLRGFLKKFAIFILALIFSVASVAAIYSQAFWNREINYEFETSGIDAELLATGYEAFRLKTITSTLDSNNDIVLTIIDEQFNELYLNISYTSDVEGFSLACQGTYKKYFWSGSGQVQNVGSAFSCMGLTPVNKTKMFWADVGYQTGGPTGYGLQLHFIPNVEQVSENGLHTATIKIEMGNIT